MFDEWANESYAQYCPGLVDKWQEGRFGEVVAYLMEEPPEYTSVFCVDLVVAKVVEGTKDEKLSQLAACFVDAENGWSPQEVAEKIEELSEIWDEGDFGNMEPYDQVGEELKFLPRSVLVTFISTLFNPQDHKTMVMMKLGFLMGALINAKREIANE